MFWLWITLTLTDLFQLLTDVVTTFRVLQTFRGKVAFCDADKMT